MHTMIKSDLEKGHVILVGAGPGDVGLLTIKGKDWLMRANVVIYDHLVNSNMMRFATDSADLVYVGKKDGQNVMVLNRNCFDYHPIMHQFFHILGFAHENQRPDSYKYIKSQ